MRQLSHPVHMTHATTATIRLTTYRKKMLENLAREKGVSLSDMLRYSAAASFAIFENKTTVEATEMCLNVKSEELLEQIKWENDVETGMRAELAMVK